MLHKIFLPLSKSGFLEDGFQNHFAPPALSLGFAFECFGQVVCFLANGLVQVGQHLDLLTQREPLLGLHVVGIVDCFLELFDVLAQWLQDGVQVGFVQVGELLGFGVQDFIC